MNWFRDRINNFRLTGSQDNDSLEQEIEKKAYELWEQGGKLENTLNYYREKARQQVKDNFWKKHYNPYYLLEKKILEPGLTWIDKQAFFDILEKVGQLTIILGVISFIFTEDSRRNAEVFSAWQTITSVDEKQAGSGGRIEALEFLNSRPLRFPFIGFTKEYWYWEGKQCDKKPRLGYRFPRQNLSGLSAPNAYLAKINLCGAIVEQANLQGSSLMRAELQRVFMPIADLQNAYLLQANLQGAYLRESNLQGAWLMGANLHKAYLGGANLINTNLEGSNLKLANFRGANLLGASLQTNTLGEVDNFEGASYGNSETNPSFCPIKHNNYNNCSTIFPDGFDPNKAGMYLIITPEDYEEWKKYRETMSF